MTDNEIIKALECCADCHGSDCSDCPCQSMGSNCEGVSLEALDYINRLEAEKEKLVGTLELEKGKVKRLKEELKTVAVDQKVIKTFSIKEFVEKAVFEIVNKPSEFTAEQATADFLSGSAHRQNEIIDIIEKMAVICDE